MSLSTTWLEETERSEDVCEGPYTYFKHSLKCPQRTKSKFEVHVDVWKGERERALDVKHYG